MTFEVVSPIDGKVYLEREYVDPKPRLARAAEAQQDWARTALHRRMEVLEAFLDTFLRQPGLAQEITCQMGRPISQTPGELGGFKERALRLLELAPEALADIEIEHSPAFRRFIRRQPLGIVLVVAAWNYPYLIAVNSVVPALLSGNAVLLKHSSQTPLCAERMVAAFEQAGGPPGLFDFLHLTHQATEQLLADPSISQVAFTGSVEGGRAVQAALRSRFVAAGLELGGKDPAYVRADAELEKCAVHLADGAFFNSGQSCCGIERIYVHRRIYQPFLEAFQAEVEKLVLGDPLDPSTSLGPMVRARAARAVFEQTEAALAQGARALLPHRPPEQAYLAPQILTEVNHGMAVMTEETFGPVVGVMPVDSDAQAVVLMNDSRYGLTASLWSRDLEACLELGDQLETGTVFLNRCDYLDPALAWVGVKDSGRGCTLSRVGYEQLTRPKSYHYRRELP
ncbi:MAG: aldehyde dehydrogenase family protein [Vulcanimicrobiota bacterium]